MHDIINYHASLCRVKLCTAHASDSYTILPGQVIKIQRNACYELVHASYMCMAKSTITATIQLMQEVDACIAS